MSFYKFLQVSIWIAFLVVIPSGAEGAILYLDSAQEQYRQGQTFMAELRIDTEGECINTVKGDLSFPQDILTATDFSRGDSILALWVKPPAIEQSVGLISFIGGIPAGFCGGLPGDPGKPNLLGKIILKVKEVNGGQTSVKIEFLNSSQVLLNDGFGTPAKLTVKGITLNLLPKGVESPENEWQEELKKDNILPEPFEIEINKDPSVFEGKYFISFLTADKQTGIDYFEIKEEKKEWKKGESPYLLEDQSLRSIIKVKAVDKAGNERIAEYLPAKKPFPRWLIVITGFLIVGWIVFKIIRKKRR